MLSRSEIGHCQLQYHLDGFEDAYNIKKRAISVVLGKRAYSASQFYRYADPICKYFKDQGIECTTFTHYDSAATQSPTEYGTMFLYWCDNPEWKKLFRKIHFKEKHF